MVLKYQSINEDRGARRAAELRRRFRHVSNASTRRQQFGLRPAPEARTWSEANSRNARVRDIFVWSAVAAIAVFFGFIIF